MEHIAGNLTVEGDINETSVVNVLAAGARCDGVTNDTAAIQRAIDSLTGGGTVYFPPGNCLVDLLTPASNVSWQGSGSGASILTLRGARNYRVIYGIGVNNVTISGLGFRVNSAGQSGVPSEGIRGIECAGCTNVSITNCDFQQVSGTAIKLYGGRTHRIVGNTASDFVPGYAANAWVIGAHSASNSDGVIAGNSVSASDGACIVVGGDIVTGVRIADNYAWTPISPAATRPSTSDWARTTSSSPVTI
jgi:polygalacturonase